MELLVVGHHGSKYSTSYELLEAIDADWAAISVGWNSYGHPTYGPCAASASSTSRSSGPTRTATSQ